MPNTKNVSSSASTSTENGKNSLPLYNSGYLILMIVNFIISGSFYLVNTILSSYVVSRGASLALAGVIVGVFALTSLITRPFSGILVNRMSKKRVMLAALAVVTVSSFGYSLTMRPELLVLVRILHGVGFALQSTVSLVLISMVVPIERMSEGVANFGLSQMLAAAVMPNFGALIADKLGYSYVFYLAVALNLVACVILLFLRFDEHALAEAAQPAGAEPAAETKKKIPIHDFICVGLLPLGIIGGLFSLFNGVNSSFMLLIGADRGISNIALYFTVNTIAIVAIRLLLARLADRVPILRVVVPALVSAILAAVLLGLAGSLIVVLIGAVFQAAGQGMAQPSLQAECIKRVEPQKRGTASSTYFMCADIGQGSGAMIGGAISGACGYGTMYVFIGALFAVALVISLANMLKRKSV